MTHPKCHKCRKSHKHRDKKDCKSCRVITKKDFLDRYCKVARTVVIDKPGKYCLGENIKFEGEEVGQVAIRIVADNVKLDLCCNVLQQVNTTTDVTGIVIGDGDVHKNITITNGSILKFTGRGIGAFNSEAANGKSFEDLTFTDLTILECGTTASFVFASGIDLGSNGSENLWDPAVTAAYKNVIIERCNVNECIGNGAININTGENVVLRDCQANNLLNDNVGGFVVIYTFAYRFVARNLQMFSCQGNGTKSFGENFRQTGGGLIQTFNGYLKDCQFNDSFGEYEGIVNTNLSLSQDTVYENCQFNNTTGRGGFVNGVHLSDGTDTLSPSKGLKYINCQFNNTSRIGDDFGFQLIGGYTGLTSADVIFENCEAVGVKAGRDLGFGFAMRVNSEDVPSHIGNISGVTFRNCVAGKIRAGRGAVGFMTYHQNQSISGEFSVNKNVTYDNCIAYDIRGASNATIPNSKEKEVCGIWYGAFLFVQNQLYGPSTNLLIKNCRISDVHAVPPEGFPISPFSAGILTRGVSRPVLCNNSVSDCDRGILLTGTDDIAPYWIFQLAATKADALAFPPIVVDLVVSVPPATASQTFTNTDQGNMVDIDPVVDPWSVDVQRNIINAWPVDLNTLGWELGDAILYSSNGGDDIQPLVSGTTYYVVLSLPGRSKDGLIQENKVDNCILAGYENNIINAPGLTTTYPDTASAWLNNVALLNGINYKIRWSGPANPIDCGTIGSIPAAGNKYYNLSLSDRTPLWEIAVAYPEGAIVQHPECTLWVANAATLAGEEPGVSPKWDLF